jgi:regulator of RNase E activity RraB
MIISESRLRKKIRSLLSELLGAKRKESLLQRALGGSAYGGYDGYGDYYDDYYDDYGYYGSSDDGDDDGDGDDGGGED